MRLLSPASLLLFLFYTSLSQDTTRHGWPLAPFFATHPITGVFGEFRNTLTSDHFHNGVDIPSPDGSPVYSVYNGVIATIGTVASQGDNAYVRLQYNVSGLLKSDAYVHIAPNPLLIVGDSVRAFQTVIGTILPGLGHVHFTNGGPSGSTYMNGIRPVGGFSPYIDNYPPRIVSTRFFVDATNTEFPGNRVSGNVDIRVHVAETSAADPSGVWSSTTNNGTYLIGYKILSADRSTEIYVPPSNGVRFRFDRMPLDTYVANVFASGSDLSNHIYTVTNGGGTDDVNATRVVNNNFWNSTTVPVGDYTVMVFTQDTRALADTEYVSIQVTRQDFVPPSPPMLLSVLNDSTNRLTIRWSQNSDSDLLGYRLYFSLNGTTWTLRDNESRLTNATTSISYPVTSQSTIYFRLAAVDSASPTNVSAYSDVYGVRLNTSLTKTLIVDGFDRIETSGSWHDPFHSFAMTHGQSALYDFNTCANEEVINGNVNLQDYQMVLWILGDESAGDETFNSAEQAKVVAYMANGGRLFVSGSEVAWDLDRPSGPTQADRDFLRNYLKASYVGDDAGVYTVVGDPATEFAGLTLRYGVVSEGSPYEEDWPDFIAPQQGASGILRYGDQNSTQLAGIAYRGTFGTGTRPGGVVYLGFPFETITSRANRDSLMATVYRYVGVTSDVDERHARTTPAHFSLEQNYPNPFNPSTSISFSIPEASLVRVKVFDAVGREVRTLLTGRLEAGRHTVRLDAGHLSSGLYVYRLEAGAFVQTRKCLLLK